MATIITNDENYTNIANAIRNKTGGSLTYKPGDMAAAITAIPTGGGGTGPGVNINARNVATYIGKTLYNVWEGTTYRNIVIMDNGTSKCNAGAFINVSVDSIFLDCMITEYPAGIFNGADFENLTISSFYTESSEVKCQGLLNAVNAPNGHVIIDTNIKKNGTGVTNGIFCTNGQTCTLGQLSFIWLGGGTRQITPTETNHTQATRLMISLWDGKAALMGACFRDSKIKYALLDGSVQSLAASALGNVGLEAIFLSKNITTVNANALQNNTGLVVYTDVPNASSRPSGWAASLVGVSNTIYGTSKSSFMTQFGFEEPMG